MNQTQRILELVKAGTITVEQGMELLKALEGNERPRHTQPPRPPEAPAPPSRKVGRPLGSGGGQLSFDQIVQLGMYNIKPEFVQEMRDAGLDDINFDTIVQLGMYNIKPGYVLEIRQIADELGAAMPSTQKIIELGMYNIKPAYIRDMMKSGVMGLDALSEDPSSRIEAKRGKIVAAHEKLEAKWAKLVAKRVKIEQKLEVTTKEKEREKLEEMLEEITDELEAVQTDIEDALEAQLEAELEDESPQPVSESAPVNGSDSRGTLDISTMIDPGLPVSAQLAALEEAMQSVNADLGVTQDQAERFALLSAQRQITEEITKLRMDAQANLST
jgi:hypothetical protein